LELGIHHRHLSVVVVWVWANIAHGLNRALAREGKRKWDVQLCTRGDAPLL
jgi:hypothetical protein